MQRSSAVRKCEHSLIGLGLLSCLLSFSPRCGAQQDAQGANRDAISSLKTEIETLQQEQRQMETQLNAIAKLLEVRVAPSTAPTPISVKIQNEPFRGNRNASVAIVEFADFECPFCAQFARETYPKILDDYINTGKVVLFFKDFPLSGHPHALTAAEAARCAGDQGKYWVMHDDLFGHQADLSETGIAARAQTLGLDSAGGWRIESKVS